MKHVLLILFFTILIHPLYAMGSDWHYETSNGTVIADPGDATHLWPKHENTEFTNVKRWYFYKDHIIGEYVNFVEDIPKQKYFILNELNGNIQTYDNAKLFEKDLINHQLVPAFWTRWYKDHFKILDLLYGLFFIFWFFYRSVIIIPILLICGLLYGCFFVKNKFIKISCSSFILLMLILFISAIINDYYVYSI